MKRHGTTLSDFHPVVTVVLVFVASPVFGQEWEEPTEESFKLTASDDTDDDRFGRAVSISGERLVVGSHVDDDGGSAYVFRWNPDIEEWTEEQKLTASDRASGDVFGWSVTISGERLVVGAPGDDYNGRDSGSAYVFRFHPVSEEWVEEQKLTASDRSSDGNELFAWSVSLSGECLVVGNPADDDDSGAAYMYRFDPDSEEWVEEQKLTASDAAVDDEFGYSVSISGERLVVGALRDDDNAFNAGSVHFFRFDSELEEWAEAQKLTASEGAVGAFFGTSVSMSGERLVVGAAGDDNNGDTTGSAYVFRFDCELEEWAEEQKLTASDGAARDRFGESVGISGERLFVGAYEDDDDGSGSGSAYVYRLDCELAEWVEAEKLTASDAAAGDEFGFSVSISGQNMVLAARFGVLSGRSRWMSRSNTDSVSGGNTYGTVARSQLSRILI